jgi:DNA-binding transcriptional LysR family regulator
MRLHGSGKWRAGGHRRMEMQQIRYFVALAKTLNFTRASEECNVSQPALTRAIKTLEAELGGDLIRREGRLSHLTELGQRMLPILQQCYDSAQSARALARSVQRGETPSLSIAIARSLNLDLLMDHFSEMYRAFPGIQFKLRRGSGAEISQLLKNGEVDLAVGGPLGESWDRLDAWPMFTEAFDLVVGADHDLASRNDIELDVELVRGARFLVQSGGETTEEQFGHLSRVGLDVGSAHVIDTEGDLEALVVAKFGIAIAPASGLRSEKVRHVPFSAVDLRRTVAIYTVAGRQRTAEATALLNLMRSTDWSKAVSSQA